MAERRDAARRGFSWLRRIEDRALGDVRRVSHPMLGASCVLLVIVSGALLVALRQINSALMQMYLPGSVIPVIGSVLSALKLVLATLVIVPMLAVAVAVVKGSQPAGRAVVASCCIDRRGHRGAPAGHGDRRRPGR